MAWPGFSFSVFWLWCTVTLNTTADKRKHFYSKPGDQSRGEGEFKTLEGTGPAFDNSHSHPTSQSGGGEQRGTGQELNFDALEREFRGQW